MMLHLVALLLLAQTAPESNLSFEGTEQVLKTARIVSMAATGQGITGSQKVELELEGRRLKAIFKTVDTRVKTRYVFGRETVPIFRDRYQHEIAAYQLDKLLDLRLVPPVVERMVDGQPGSLQLWVERTLFRFVHGRPPPNRQRAADDVHVVRLLDYLIFNTDRHFRNLFFGEGWSPVVIDHSLAFHPMTTPARPLYRFPRRTVARLRALDQRQLKKVLGRYLEKDQIRALDQRRRAVLELVDAALAERGEGGVLFDPERPR